MNGDDMNKDKRIAELGELEKDKDAVFIILCEIARQFIY